MLLMHEHDGEADERPHETQSLARAAKSGDVERFAELYERIAPALLAWASLRIRPDMRAFVDPQDVPAIAATRASRCSTTT